jgi:SAM-dependent methyltransferase
MRSGNASHRVNDRSQFVSMMGLLCSGIEDRSNLSLLVVGGSDDDIHSLRQLGFSNTTLSNLASWLGAREDTRAGGSRQAVPIDAEDMAVPSGSCDLVFAHAVLHHCRSPHRGLCEMLRVARKYVVFMEPNDSLVMRSLVGIGFSFPYELPAVIDHGGRSGGVRNSAIPNFIYRWNKNEVAKVVASFLPEYLVRIRARSYWDFDAVDEGELALRTQTRLSKLTNLITPKVFLAMLKFGQNVANRIPLFRNQGNKFLCVIEKNNELKPWLMLRHNEIVFNLAPVSGNTNQRGTVDP